MLILDFTHISPVLISLLPRSGMIGSAIEAVLVKVSALGLDPHKHLGKTLQQV